MYLCPCKGCTKWVWLLLSTGCVTQYDLGGKPIILPTQKGRKKEDIGTDRGGRMVKNRWKKNCSASCLCQIFKGPATKIIYWKVILDYEFALSVNSEKICRVHIENENLRFFLILKKATTKTATNTNSWGANEMQIF